MGWIRAHPYASALTVAGILIVCGTLVVEERAPVAPNDSHTTWSAGIPLVPYASGAPQTQSPQAIAQAVIQNQSPATLVVPSNPPAASTPNTAGSASDPSDLAALLAQISPSTSAQKSASGNSSTTQIMANAYRFIPQGLVATTAPAHAPMTADQEALYEYGNTAGAVIQSFETQHPDQAQVLKDQAEDRTDPTKAAALVALGQALAFVGTQLQQMGDVPPSVQTLHAALAQSYVSIGTQLALVPQAQDDKAFVKAIESYDSAADAFTRNYAALAEFLSLSGVSFSSQDPGSVFSFTPSSGM